MRQITFGVQDWLYLGRSFWKLVLVLLIINTLGVSIFAVSEPRGLVIWSMLCITCFVGISLMQYDVGLVFTYGFAVMTICMRQFLLYSRPYDPSFELLTAFSFFLWLIVMVYSTGKFAHDNKIHRFLAAAAIFKIFLTLFWVTKIWQDGS